MVLQILLVLVLPHNLHRDIMMEINLHLMLVISLPLRVFFNLMELIFQSQQNSGQGSRSYNNTLIGLEVMVDTNLNSMVLEMEIHGNLGLVILIIGMSLFLNVRFVLERVTLQ